jgi:hypothetical protein
MGFASSLAETALQWAREHNLKVDIICTGAAICSEAPGARRSCIVQILYFIDVLNRLLTKIASSGPQIGARYVSTKELSLTDVSAKQGPCDFILEGTGYSSLVLKP